MKSIHQYNFHRSKYGAELLIDVIELDEIRKYLNKNPIHKLTYYDFTLITEGSVDILLNGEKYRLYPGDIAYSIPGEVWDWRLNNSVKGYILVFEEEFLLSFFNDPDFLRNFSYLDPDRGSSKLSLPAGHYNRVLQLLKQIMAEIKSYRGKDHHILRAMLYEILTLFNRVSSSANTTSTSNVNINRHVNRFIELVNSEFIYQRNIQYYADKLCITTNYLNKVVQNKLGISAKHFVQRKVLQEAKKMLDYTTLSVAEIADKLNFRTASYFTRCFYKNTGITPTQYRKAK